MKKFSWLVLSGLFLLMLSSCSTNKKDDSIETSSTQQTTSTKQTSSTLSSTTSENTHTTETTSIEETTSTEPVQTTVQNTTTSTAVVQEESYEEMKQRTLNSTPAERVSWSDKEWEAFGMALYENGLALDDAGNIITQAEQQVAATQAAQSVEPSTLTEFINKYGMSPVAYKMQYEGMSEEEALQSTSNDMKSSGEIQRGFIEYGIQ
ncbi:MAG: hypothetical protein Q6A85_10910 [Enterococcus mundtii]|nr:hypothetical protein [Enterococcus mundtii]